MRTTLEAIIGLAAIILGSPSVGRAADSCPQLSEAQAALARASRSEQVREAQALLREAEAACEQGDTAVASRKAQDVLSLLRNVPATGHRDIEVGIAPAGKEPVPTRPGDAGYYQPPPNVSHDPMFIGPTGRTRTGELGFSAWIAPTTPVGSEVAGGWRQQGGTPAIGFTFTWGGASRPEPLQAP
jgi:hypothetical protein